jgi:hypothetical protein
VVIATRVLTLRRPAGDVAVPVRLHAPEAEDLSWACRFEIGWPDGLLAQAGYGADAVQAIELAMRMIGALLYRSDHHQSGALMWDEPGQGYGFPVPTGIRDVLVGYDKDYF